MTEEKPRFSFSDIRTFQECPFRLRERKAKRYAESPTEAMLVGSYAHAMLEGDKSTDDFIQEHSVDMMGNIGKKNQGIKKVFKDIVMAVNEVKKTETYQSFDTLHTHKELYIRADYDDFVISGRIDVLRFDHENKTIEIIDWKTAASFEDIFDKNIRAYLEWYSHYREQLALYAWLVAQEFSDYTKLDYTVVGKIVGFTKKLPVNIKTITMDFGNLADISDKILVQTVLSELDNIAHNIEHEGMDGYFCHNCDCCIQNKKYEELEVEVW